VYRTYLRIAAIVGLMSGLSACAAIQESRLLQPDFWGLNGPKVNDKAELGLGELAKGDTVLALSHFQNALKVNPNDVQALYGLAVLYQNSGQPTHAQQLYEQILALNPAPVDEILIWADSQTHPIVDIAQVNLQLLKSGGMVPPVGAKLPARQPSPSSMAPVPVQPVIRMQPQQPMQAGGSFYRPQTAQQPMSQTMAQPMAQPVFKETDLHIVARFKTMRALLEQGLITQEEFVTRRKVNVGALLPLTSAPPSSGMDRSVPPVEQVSGRLRAIGRALEMRALSPSQHTAERSMILDALMPANPSSVANPAPPPKGLMEAADEVRRLELLKAADLITSDEYSKERAAIEAFMQPRPTTSSLQKSKPTGNTGKAQVNLSGFQPAIHLASFRQQKAATRGWRLLKKKFRSLLGGLKSSIERVDLGGGKGVFYRLKAGPLPSNAAAKDACRKLKSKRQYCDPTTINFG